MTDFPQLGRTGTGELFATTIVHCHCAATHNSCPRLTPPTSLTVSPSLSHEYAKAWRESGGEGREIQGGREGERERAHGTRIKRYMHTNNSNGMERPLSLSLSLLTARCLRSLRPSVPTRTQVHTDMPTGHTGANRCAEKDILDMTHIISLHIRFPQISMFLHIRHAEKDSRATLVAATSDTVQLLNPRLHVALHTRILIRSRRRSLERIPKRQSRRLPPSSTLDQPPRPPRQDSPFLCLAPRPSPCLLCVIFALWVLRKTLRHSTRTSHSSKRTTPGERTPWHATREGRHYALRQPPMQGTTRRLCPPRTPQAIPRGAPRDSSQTATAPPPYAVGLSCSTLPPGALGSLGFLLGGWLSLFVSDVDDLER